MGTLIYTWWVRGPGGQGQSCGALILALNHWGLH